jgi:hypothetical protein
MRALKVSAVVIALGLAVSACDQGGQQGMSYGGVAAADASQAEALNQPDLAPVNGRDPIATPGTSLGGSGTLGNYDGGSAQQ